jgi:hypothetical protein
MMMWTTSKKILLLGRWRRDTKLSLPVHNKKPWGNPRGGRVKNMASDYKHYISRGGIWHHIWWDGQKYGKKYGGKYGGLALEIMGLTKSHHNEYLLLSTQIHDEAKDEIRFSGTIIPRPQSFGSVSFLSTINN